MRWFPRHLFLAYVVALYASATIIVLSTDYQRFAWWLGTRPTWFYLLAIAIAFALGIIFANWIDDVAKRRADRSQA